MRLRWTIWLFCFLEALTVSAQGSLKTTLDSTRMLIGGRMGVTIVLEDAPEVDALVLDMPGKDSIPELELVGKTDWKREGQDWTGRIGLTVFDTGYYILPPFVVSGILNGEQVRFESPSLAINVMGIPLDTAGVKAIKPIIEEPVNWTDFQWIVIALGVLLLFLGLVWLFRKLKKAPEWVPEVVPPRDAHLIALEKLEKLEADQLWQKDEIKTYYIRLGDILREYFELRFQFPALEMTSAELRLALKDRNELMAYSHQAEEFFSMADMVKFARGKPDADIHENWMHWVREIVLATRNVPEPDGSEDNQEIKTAGKE